MHEQVMYRAEGSRRLWFNAEEILYDGRTGQELLHTKSPRLRLLRLHGLLRSSLFLIFRLFTSFLLDDRLQAAGDAVDFAVSAFVGSEIDILVTMVEDGVRVAALAVPVAPCLQRGSH